MTGDYFITWRRHPLKLCSHPLKETERERDGGIEREGGRRGRDRDTGESMSLDVHISKKGLPGP